MLVNIEEVTVVRVLTCVGTCVCLSVIDAGGGSKLPGEDGCVLE